jgi:hypothetical protein
MSTYADPANPTLTPKAAQPNAFAAAPPPAPAAPASALKPPVAAPQTTIPQAGYGPSTGAPATTGLGSAAPAAPLQTLAQHLASTQGATPAGGTAVSGAQWLKLNPQLVAAPLSKVTDSLYLAQEAQLRAQTARQYNDILQQLGYQDPNSNAFIKGDVEIGADRQMAELQHNMMLAHEGVTDDSQRAGTLFSGYRGTQTARAEHPFVQSMADLDVDVPKQLSRLYQQAENTLQDYTIQQNLLLAQAAMRAISALASGDDSGGPPADPRTPPPH